jgi:ABC-type transporter Mla maintaining outer membrane lipid asymmetry ATPase subunit MlaF
MALLDRGRLVVRGTAADLDRSDNALVREFMQSQGGG